MKIPTLNTDVIRESSGGKVSGSRVAMFLIVLSFLFIWIRTSIVINDIAQITFEHLALVLGSVGFKVWGKVAEKKPG